MRAVAAESRWYTVTEEADLAKASAAYRGALHAQRHRIGAFSVDVLSDQPWPADILWAVEILDRRLAPKKSRLLPGVVRSPGVTVYLRLDDDADFALAMAIAPFTIGGTGIGDEGRIIWDGNDTGTSAAFDLTNAELEQVRLFIAEHRGEPEQLVPLHRPSRI